MRDRNGLHSRRDLLAGGGLVLGSFAFWLPALQAAEEISRSAESIHQETTFAASRKRVYQTLLDAKRFHEVEAQSAAVKSGMRLGTKPTAISTMEGGAFSLFGGHITGRHIELVPDQRIVQAWRAGDWGPGVYSIARFDLLEAGSGTRLVFDHTGFPAGEAQHLAEGWRTNYWEPMQKVLG